MPEAVARLNRAGFLAIVITNQSGIARGLVTEEDLAAMHVKLRAAVEAAGGSIAGIYYCPHMPDERCKCRKPAPGLLLQAAADLGIDPRQSWLVGDRPDDIACGHAAGCTTILTLTGMSPGYNPGDFAKPPDYATHDLSDAVGVILSERARAP